MQKPLNPLQVAVQLPDPLAPCPLFHQVSHYALHNVSSATTLNAFRTLAYVSEGMVFIYVGMDCLDPQKWKVGSQE